MSEMDDKIREMFSKPSCRCLHEIENELPRTMFCLVPCRGQHEILSRRASNEWWKGLDDVAKKELSENFETLTEEEIEKLHITEHRKNYFKNKNK